MELAFNSSAYSYTPRDDNPAYSIEEACQRISDAGWDRVELAGVRPHAHPADNSPEQFDRVQRALNDAGLEAAHLCCHQIILGLNPASPDAAERQATIDHLRGLAEFCDALDIPRFHLHPGWSLGDQSIDAAWEQAVETVNVAFDDAPLENVQPSIEPISWPGSDMIHTPAQGRDFIDDVDHDVKLLVDTFHCHRDDIPLRDAILTAGDELDVIHLADTDRLAPGDGDLDFELVAEALDDIGFDGLASVEIWGKDPDIMARRAYETAPPLFADI